MKTYLYQKKVSVTTEQGITELPRLRSILLINAGPNDVFVNFGNDINNDSSILMVGGNLSFDADFLDVRLKTLNEGETATIYLTGLRHEKSE